MSPVSQPARGAPIQRSAIGPANFAEKGADSKAVAPPKEQ
jgi:hypothetical protein